MNNNSEFLNKLRTEIDIVDDQIKALFEKRMSLALDIAKHKKAHGVPVLNEARERDILARVTQGLDDEMAEYTRVLFATLFDLSRACQSRRLR